MTNFRDLKLHEERLKNGVKKFVPEEQERILNAFDLAEMVHRDQKRDEGDPYIIHPIRIANTLIYDLGISTGDMIIAGLLHDVVEDTNTTLNEITKKFSENVSRLVNALTRYKERETKKDKFKKTISGPEEIRLLKACDCLDNLRSFVYRTDRGERWQRHLQEAKDMYIPLARATGNEWLMTEMEKAYDEVLRLRQ